MGCRYPPPEDRFWSYTEKRASEECWLWTSTRSKGYGQLWVNGHFVYAHRFSWELHRGPVTDKLHVLHKCDNPSCVNPNHLFLGTHQDNMKDRDKKGRRTAPQGSKHPMSKLTEDQIPIIRGLRAEGLTYSKIADRFSVSKDMIYRVCKGLNWSHV